MFPELRGKRALFQSRMSPVFNLHFEKEGDPLEAKKKDVSIPYESGLQFTHKNFGIKMVLYELFQSRMSPVFNLHLVLAGCLILPLFFVSIPYESGLQFTPMASGGERNNWVLVSIPYESGLQFTRKDGKTPAPLLQLGACFNPV